MLEATRHTLKTAGIDETPREVVADTGYWNEEAIAKEKPEMTEFFLNLFRRARKRKEGGETKKKARTPIEEKRQSERVREILKRGGGRVDGVLSPIKTVQGATRFMRRGLVACSSEWKLIGAAHNFLKLWRAVNKKTKRGDLLLGPLSGMTGEGSPGGSVHRNGRRDAGRSLVPF